jgi:predicted CXXCH cytochrome family protein
VRDRFGFAQRAVFAGLFALTATVEAAYAQGSRAEETRPEYVGSQICGSCHADEFAAWQESHHAWAWRAPTADTVLGDFDGAVFDHKGVTTRFFKGETGFLIETEGAEGNLKPFPVVGTVGVAPLQQYLIETAPGRLQVLDIAWDNVEKRWYHLYPDLELPHTSGLHWTGPYKTWNARCAECHATDFKKNYDPLSGTYASTQAEIGVGCEACHGPGEAHAAWARSPQTFKTDKWPEVSVIGLTLPKSRTDANRDVQLCAGCHARREPLGDSSPPPGSAFANHYHLALLRDGLYFPDGQILDEVYVYGSFLQSKMHARGVRCTNCHEPHSSQLKADGNAVCTQCHGPTGNPSFLTLRKSAYDSPEHHRHPPGTAGAMCVSCHMPARIYMGIDSRRDHGFRIPRPDLTLRIGTPNACNDCHESESAAWAAEQITRWIPERPVTLPHYGELFAAAREGADSRTIEGLLALVGQEGTPAIVRATALDLLAGAGSQELTEKTAPLLSDPSPLVRAAAIPLQRFASPAPAAQRIAGLLDDPARSVRIAAARNLLGSPATQSLTGERSALRSAMREIGGAALVLRNLAAAERAFSEAVNMDPQLGDGWIMLSRVQVARRDIDAALQTLHRAIDMMPEEGILYHTLGGVLATSGRQEDAVKWLQQAVTLMPEDSVVSGDLGVVLARLGRHREALPVLEKTLQLGEGPPNILYHLIVSQMATGNRSDAERTLLKLEILYPESPMIDSARRLLKQ